MGAWAQIIKDSGLTHLSGPMGTCIEGEWSEVMSVVNKCFEALQKDCDRAFLTLQVDYRKGAKGGRLTSMPQAVQQCVEHCSQEKQCH